MSRFFQSSSPVAVARARTWSADFPHSLAIERTGVSARLATAHELNPSASRLRGSSRDLVYSSSSSDASSAITEAAAASAAARWATTSRSRHPSLGDCSSHRSGGVYWMVRPSASRSARAMPRSQVRSRFIGLPFPSRPMIPARCGAAFVAGYPQRVPRIRVVIAPDKFKGTLTAPEAARALASGWRRGDPDAEIEEVPVADGGEGTLHTLLAALGGEKRHARGPGPLGGSIDAEYGLVRTREGLVAIVEMAMASGLALLGPDRRDPLRASTFGTGELILAACGHEPNRIIVCVGGSATNDGGAGAAQAPGVRLLDENGNELAAGGGALGRLTRIDAG